MTRQGLARSVAGGVVFTLLIAGCFRVPYTKRISYNAVPDKVMRDLGRKTYKEMLGESTLIASGRDVDRLQAVKRRVSTVVKRDDGYAWKANLIESDDLNAWCLPGGYIGFYTGILPTLENEAGMAFVMGHEVAHAVARHGGERLTQNLTLLGGMAAVYLYMDGKTKISDNDKAIIVGALGLGAYFGAILPFSRKHESEADVLGMMYMARAGYPPSESVKVWNRMKSVTGPNRKHNWMATHPSFAKRKQKQKEWMPHAAKRFKRSKKVSGALEKRW